MENQKSISIPIPVVTQQLDTSELKEIKSIPYKSCIVKGIRLEWAHLRLKISLVKIAIKLYSRPTDWLWALQKLISLRRRFLGDNRIKKMAFVDGRYYMWLYTPGWNGKIYQKFIASQLNDIKPAQVEVNRFNTVLFAITKKCPLKCEHCYEWDNLNKKDVFSEERLMQTLQKLQEYGVGQIQFSGGEPLLKMDLLETAISAAHEHTDCWVATSGFKLTSENALRLKKVGLTGVIISLDHFEAEKHNAFRNFESSFDWIMQAIQNAHHAKLVVALSVCVTKEFISEENLMSYMQLAKKMNVSFVQFLEPKPVGHYKNEDVLLQKEHIEILEQFYLRMNFGDEFKSFPIITYHGYYQRRQGCFSAGAKSIYVDTDGDVNACTFCHKKYGNVLDDNFQENLHTLQQMGCPSYNQPKMYTIGYSDVEIWIAGTVLYLSRYLLVAGFFYAFFYIWNKKRWSKFKLQQVPIGRKQLSKELLYSILTFVIYGLGIWLLLYWVKNDHTQLYVDLSEYGWGYFGLSIILMILMHDTYFYWTHRLIHHPKLFKYIHKIHHSFESPTPWAAFAFHPFEAIVSLGIIPIILFSIPFHHWALILFISFLTIYNTYIHLGFMVPKLVYSKWQNTSNNHDLHHRGEHANFGLYFTFWDRLMGTYKADGPLRDQLLDGKMSDGV